MNAVTMTPICCLLVDDLEENLLALEALLRQNDVELLKARSGPEALELLLQHDVALALVDVQMPGMSGFELAELMRGTERTRRVPIMFLTAGNTDHTRRFRGYETGAVDFLQKPLEPDVLRSKANVFFELYRQRQEVGRQRDELRSATEEIGRLLAESRQHAETLREANARKDEFLAMLAHELRNPLAPIRNAVELLLHSGGMDPATVRSASLMMERQVAQMVRLVDDLLDVNRINRGKIDLRRAPVELAPIIHQAIEAVRPMMTSAQHELTVSLPTLPMFVLADSARLAQVIGNLLNNASKFTDRGGKISVSVSEQDGRVAIRVKDNGVGLDPQQLAHIFDMFWHADSSLERSVSGLGIGLTLVKTLVELHEGTVLALSGGPGTGTEFVITLPMHAATPDITRQQMLSGEGADVRSFRILVVDDNQDAARSLAALLARSGHETHVAFSGSEALQRSVELRPDVLLLDIGLPEINGYDVARRIRAEAWGRDAVLIALTGWGQEADRSASRAAGFNHHLVKPVDYAALVGVLRSLTDAAPAVP